MTRVLTAQSASNPTKTRKIEPAGPPIVLEAVCRIGCTCVGGTRVRGRIRWPRMFRRAEQEPRWM